MDQQNSKRKGTDIFHIAVQCVQCSAERLALHLAEFFPSTVGRSFEIVAVKQFSKELENDDHKNKRGGEFILFFLRQNHNEGVNSSV